MTGSHIPALSALRPVLLPTSRAPSQQGTRVPMLGEFLKLTLDEQEGTLSATSRAGTLVKLPPGTLEGELSPGDVLMVKVLATTPQLELARVGRAVPMSADSADARTTSPEQAPAMRPDQTAMLRMAWAPPDAATLASNWRVLVLAHLRHIATARAPLLTSDWTVPHALLPAMESGQSSDRLATHWSPIERWLFPVHAWAGLPLTLQLLPPRSGPREGRARRRPQGWGLRVHGLLPGLGQIEIHAQLSTEGASLLIVADDEQTLQRLRETRDAITRAVNRAGWRLRACQMLRSLPPENNPSERDSSAIEGSQIDESAHTTTSSSLPQGLFRVTTEVLLTLGALGIKGRISPAFR